MEQWWQEPVRVFDAEAAQAAAQRQSQLTKPHGALGRLEGLAVRLAGFQGQDRPTVDDGHIAVFAADHGLAAEGVSRYPQAVTTQMVHNFATGGAAINALARHLGATLEVVDAGIAEDPGPLPGVLARRVAAGTANARYHPAMSLDQLLVALEAGREAATRARQTGTQLFVGGDMGIANTTTAAAVACALLEETPANLVGPGTGLNPDGVHHKAIVIRDMLHRHQTALQGGPLAALASLGGFEIAALAGAFVRAAQEGMPVLVDGFIATVAALVATRIQPEAAGWLLYAHISAEPGHRRVLQALHAHPLLDLGMRLGEGSGAAVAVPLLRAACAVHRDMATFAEAGVSEATQ